MQANLKAVLACAWLCALCAGVQAGEPPSAQTLRAALLFNFIKFTEWPAAARDQPQLTVCVASSDAAQSAALGALGGRSIRKQVLLVLPFVTSLHRDADCDVVYVDSRRRWNEISRLDNASRALTIGDFAGFIEAGGMIEISLQEDGTHFDINLPPARQIGLRLYPQLLKLARRVVE